MLKEVVKSKGVKQSYLAQRIGVSSVTVSNWMTGKTSPSKKHLEKLSEVLEVPIKDLVH
ncbi:helix-turn-helix domain-containing protein [Flavobacteriales bacterium]|nr:helix-turn-helix domain-containing protein [Flavobacteriales bacterium]